LETTTRDGPVFYQKLMAFQGCEMFLTSFFAFFLGSFQMTDLFGVNHFDGDKTR